MSVEIFSRKASTVLIALSIGGLLLSACAPTRQPTPTPTPTQPLPTPTPQPTATFTPVPPTATPTPIPPTAAPTATPTPTPDYTALFPPFLPYDWYPNGMTREDILARLPEAVRKTGHVGDETWSGGIRITGDLRIYGTITVEPGTVIYVAARSDDQQGAPWTGPKDEFNPKDPVKDENYCRNRIEIRVEPGAEFVARGTPEKPIIITSDSQNPQSDDWLQFTVSEGGKVEMEYTVMEYFRNLASSSEEMKITKSILRNMMECIVIASHEPDPLALSLILTHNYIYNCGHNCITVRNGSPIIRHNIIRARPDMEFPGFEYGAVDFDFFTKAIFEHNFVEGGPPVPYNEYDIWGNYHEFLYGQGLGLHSLFGASIRYNTFYNSALQGVTMNAFPSILLENNNFLDNNYNLFLIGEPGYPPCPDVYKDFLENYKKEHPITIIDPFVVTNNYWGTTNEKRMRDLTKGGIELIFIPYKTRFIKEALPDWSWLKEWLQ